MFSIYLFILLIIVLLFILLKLIIKKNKENFNNNLTDNIGMVYYINLNKRTDRKEEIIGEINKLNLKSDQIERVPGVYIEDFGALGCSYSHIECLNKFIKSGKKNCIIFEDDFMFKEDTKYIELLNEFFNLNVDYDVCMLSVTIPETTNSEYSILNKVIVGVTTAGYIVNKKFANKLLDNYVEGAKLLKETKNEPLYAIDRYWNKLQRSNNFYVFNPVIGKQRSSYSDIFKVYVERDNE